MVHQGDALRAMAKEWLAYDAHRAGGVGAEKVDGLVALLKSHGDTVRAETVGRAVCSIEGHAGEGSMNNRERAGEWIDARIYTYGHFGGRSHNVESLAAALDAAEMRGESRMIERCAKMREKAREMASAPVLECSRHEEPQPFRDDADARRRAYDPLTEADVLAIVLREIEAEKNRTGG